MQLLQLVWDADPRIFPGLFENIGIEPRWYGVLFAVSFLLGFQIIKKALKREDRPEDWADSLLIYVMIGTILGARMGHVLFYDFAYYSQNPGEILQIWRGGLASHGAAIGNILALWVWSKRVSKQSVLWSLDRVVIPVALAGSFIRLGNFINSEIIGSPTSVPWAVIFAQVDDIPRHPTQLYESMAYLLIFALLYVSFFKFNKGSKQGFLFGVFLALVFGFRFLIEFIKDVQKDFESDMVLNMGQWLSILPVIAGIYFIVKSRK